MNHSAIFQRKFNSDILGHYILSTAFWWQAFLSSESITSTGCLTICLSLTSAWLSMTYSTDIIWCNMAWSSSLRPWQSGWHSEEMLHISVPFRMKILWIVYWSRQLGVFQHIFPNNKYIFMQYSRINSLHSNAANLTHFYISGLISIITVSVISQLLINTRPPPSELIQRFTIWNLMISQWNFSGISTAKYNQNSLSYTTCILS